MDVSNCIICQKPTGAEDISIFTLLYHSRKTIVNKLEETLYPYPIPVWSDKSCKMCFNLLHALDVCEDQTNQKKLDIINVMIAKPQSQNLEDFKLVADDIKSGNVEQVMNSKRHKF